MDQPTVRGNRSVVNHWLTHPGVAIPLTSGVSPEKARDSKHLIVAKSAECWPLITSADHRPRAVSVFRSP